MTKSTEAKVATNEMLTKLEAEVATPPSSPGAPSTVAMAVADQMVHRAAAAMSDVHAHAMSRVAGMREQLDSLEQTILEARDRAESHMTKFMQLVTDGEESIRSMEKAIARVEDHLVETEQ